MNKHSITNLELNMNVPISSVQIEHFSGFIVKVTTDRKKGVYSIIQYFNHGWKVHCEYDQLHRDMDHFVRQSWHLLAKYMYYMKNRIESNQMNVIIFFLLSYIIITK